MKKEQNLCVSALLSHYSDMKTELLEYLNECGCKFLFIRIPNFLLNLNILNFFILSPKLFLRYFQILTILSINTRTDIALIMKSV